MTSQRHYAEQLRAQKAAAALKMEQQRMIQQRAEKKKLKAFYRARYINAAVVIQRAWRSYNIRRRDEAALIITRTLRDNVAISHARRITTSLRSLQAQRARVNDLTEAYMSNPWGYRSNLMFVDTLEKLILGLDTISTYGDAFCRAARRRVVSETQSALRYADVVARTQSRAACILQRAVRMYQARVNADVRDRAAHIVTRTIRAIPVIRRAKESAASLREIRKKRRRLQELRDSLAVQLRALSEEVAALPADTDTAVELKTRTENETVSLLQAIMKASSFTTSTTTFEGPSPMEL